MQKHVLSDKGFVFTVKRRKNDVQPVQREPTVEPQNNCQLTHLPSGETCVDITFPMPTSDTPRIIKNKKFREEGGRRRRSSLGLRGKRISSLDSSITGLPHETIEPQQYYRLLDAEQSDPIRMRQLLVWCSQKAMQTLPNRMSSSCGSVDLIVREIQLEIIAALHSREINVSWYHRPTDGIETAQENATVKSNSGKLPHPANTEHAANIILFKKQRAAYQLEEDQWKSVIERHNKEHEILKAAEAQNVIISYDTSEIANYMPPRFESVMKNSLSTELSDFSKVITNDMLLNVHHLQDTIHRYQIASDVLGESCESTYARMLRAFELRDAQEAKNIDPVDLLKLFSTASSATVSTS
ncbi:hypothetical protein RTP6_006146 [Batrachochytrium dendrobatidis]